MKSRGKTMNAQMNNPFSETEEKEDREVAMVPNYAFEKTSDRYMTIIKWLIIVIIILIVSFVGYVVYNSQMEAVSWEQEAEADSGSTVTINGSGEMTVNGWESETKNNGQTEENESSEWDAD